MNIFFLSPDVDECAAAHTNRHVVKMILETCQLLCSVHHILDPDGGAVPYKLTHKNHPCAMWARTSVQNYSWLVRLGQQLCREYSRRYGGRTHASQEVLTRLAERGAPASLPSDGWTPPPQAMPTMYHVSQDPVAAYRLYYRQEKRHLFAWKTRDMPTFLRLPYVEELRSSHRSRGVEAWVLESVAAGKRKRDA